MATVKRQPTKWISFKATFRQSEKTEGTCVTCGGMTRRSWVTKIMHVRCRFCRYLIMMYGPNIQVVRRKA